MAGSEGEEVDPLLLLGGTSLRVYLYLLQSTRPVGVREVQRALGFRSPSTARHHLERLVELGLARREGWGYRALKPGGVLGRILVVHGRILPRSLFLAAFLSTAALLYSLLPGSDPRAVVLLAIASAIAVVDSLRLYRQLSRLLRAGG